MCSLQTILLVSLVLPALCQLSQLDICDIAGTVQCPMPESCNAFPSARCRKASLCNGSQTVPAAFRAPTPAPSAAEPNLDSCLLVYPPSAAPPATSESVSATGAIAGGAAGGAALIVLLVGVIVCARCRKQRAFATRQATTQGDGPATTHRMSVEEPESSVGYPGEFDFGASGEWTVDSRFSERGSTSEAAPSFTSSSSSASLTAPYPQHSSRGSSRGETHGMWGSSRIQSSARQPESNRVSL